MARFAQVSKTAGILPQPSDTFEFLEAISKILGKAQKELPAGSEYPTKRVTSVDVQDLHQSGTSRSSPHTESVRQPPSKRVRSDYEEHSRPSYLDTQPVIDFAGAEVLYGNIVDVDATGQAASDHGRYWPESSNISPLVSTGSTEAWSKVVLEAGYFGWPRALNLPHVFPHDMCTSIVKSNGLASVVLSIKDPANCCMTLEISSTSVQLIANDMFGVKIRFLAQRRHVYFENGVTVHSPGILELRGANASKIDHILGGRVGKAFRESSRRVEETLLGEELSSAVSFELDEKAESSGRLTIMLELEQSFMICRRLSGDQF